MSKIKESLDQIGFSFDGLDKDEIARKHQIHRKILDLKSKQKKIETVVKLYNPTNKEELREVWRSYEQEIKKLETK